MKDRIEHVWSGWHVERMIGAGTFGQVYEIKREIVGFSEQSALKVISIPVSRSEINEYSSQGYDNQTIIKHYDKELGSFLKEYQTMTYLKGCTNAVYCDDVRYERHENGIGWDIFIKMELLEPAMTRLGLFDDEREIIKLGIDICNALSFCSKINIVHRDIKPQNVFVSKDGSYKLGDFGISKNMEKTVGGTKTGSYNYMAPEVYNNKPYGSAADQYSLGLTLYWLLNDRTLPFIQNNGDIPSAFEIEEAREKRFTGEKLPEPVNGSELLKEIVMKACSYRPEDRFKSPEDMKNALVSLLTGSMDQTEKHASKPVAEETPVSEEPVTEGPDEIPDFEPVTADGDGTVGVGFGGFGGFGGSETFSEFSSFSEAVKEEEETAEDTFFDDKSPEIEGDGTMGNNWGEDPKPQPKTQQAAAQTSYQQSFANTAAKSEKFPNVLGIDLDTKKCSVAIYEDGKAVVVPNKKGHLTTSTKDIFYTDGTVVLREAVRMLTSLTQNAQLYANRTFDKAVIAVPAMFDYNDRMVIRDAASRIGLDVRVISQTAAAACMYEREVFNGNQQKALFVNVGSSSMEVTAADLGTDVVEILATETDTSISGKAIDEIIAKKLLYTFLKEHKINLTSDKLAMMRIMEAAEKAKIDLCSANTTTINLPYITSTINGPLHLNMDITNDMMKHYFGIFQMNIINAIRNCSSIGGLIENKIDNIVLLGNSAKIPWVQEVIRSLNRKASCNVLNGLGWAAKGAAHKCANITGNCGQLLLDVVPHSVCIETLGGVATKLIDKNTTIPTLKEQVFSTAADNQAAVEVNLLAGEAPMAAQNKSIGRFSFTGFSLAPKGVPQITVSIGIDAGGMISVTAKEGDKVLSVTRKEHSADTKAGSTDQKPKNSSSFFKTCDECKGRGKVIKKTKTLFGSKETEEICSKCNGLKKIMNI